MFGADVIGDVVTIVLLGRRVEGGQPHGIDPELSAAVRGAAREFFDLPDEVKERYSVAVGGHEGVLASTLSSRGKRHAESLTPAIQ